MVGPGGLEPPTPALSTRCSNQLSYEPKFKKEFNWWSRSGSNRRPPECKSGALPTELWPHLVEILKNEAVKEPAKFILYDQSQPSFDLHV